MNQYHSIIYKLLTPLVNQGSYIFVALISLVQQNLLLYYLQ